MPTPQLFGDELLTAVFANFTGDEPVKFRATESSLTSVFYDLLCKPEFRPLAAAYPFDADGPEPRSKALSDAFDSLQQSRLVGRLNPDLVVYQVSDSLRTRYQKYIAPKLGRREHLVKQLASQVQAELNS